MTYTLIGLLEKQKVYMLLGSLPSRTLAQSLQPCIDHQCTGKLIIQGSKSQRWSLVFFMGRLIRDEDGLHPSRRYRRQLSLYCPQLKASTLKQPTDPATSRSWGYQTVLSLLSTEKINAEQGLRVLEGALIETLFDIVQAETLSRSRYNRSLTYSWEVCEQDSLPQIKGTPLIPQSVQYLSQQVLKRWDAWQNTHIATRSPNSSPIILEDQKLREMVKSKVIYQSLITLVDGDRTFRDLAVKVGQRPDSLAQSFLPYINAGVMDVVDVPDLKPRKDKRQGTVTKISLTPLSMEQLSRQMANRAKRRSQSSRPRTIRSTVEPNYPIIAYLGDSTADAQRMEEIFRSSHYQFITIHDPLSSIPILLRCHPKLMFVGLKVSMVDRYKLCAQLRRIPDFKQLPILMMAHRNSLVERLRARLAGASGLFTQPIEETQVLPLLKDLDHELLTPNLQNLELESSPVPLQQPAAVEIV
ncbi:MAG: response regulator [Merismopedia sp. SIO2A8]|nr:response regulator [Merismopedia sp. SIO2A8]